MVRKKGLEPLCLGADADRQRMLCEPLIRKLLAEPLSPEELRRQNLPEGSVVVFSMMLFVRAWPRGQGAKKEEAVLT